jgi:hypothetical protein
VRQPSRLPNQGGRRTATAPHAALQAPRSARPRPTRVSDQPAGRELTLVTPNELPGVPGI